MRHNQVRFILGTIMQHLKKIMIAALSLCITAPTWATEFDQYLQDKQIIDGKFKIKKSKQLDELLKALSAEDSRTLPLQIDQNTIIEKLQLSSTQTELHGLIITPDFAQFEQDLGNAVEGLIKTNLRQNCDIFFEHEYQRANPYRIMVHLNSAEKHYSIELKFKDCTL